MATITFIHRVTKLARERLSHIFSQSAFHFEQPDHSFEGNLNLPDILIDLSHYADQRILQLSMHLLNR